MKLRPYNKEDSESIVRILLNDGHKPHQMKYGDGGFETFVMMDDDTIAGFFTITPLRNIYLLQHFALDSDHRTIRHWRALERFMRMTLFIKKCPVVVMSIPRDNDRMNWMIEKRYHKEPYEKTETTAFYSINVMEDIKNVWRRSELPGTI